MGPIEDFWHSDWNAASFLLWAGMRITAAAEGRAAIELQVQEHHRGGGGTSAVNGGILAYMLDTVLGAAAHSLWDMGVVGQVTIHLDINYLTMVHADATVRGEAEVTRRGRSTVFVEGKIFTEDAQLGATATGVYHLFRKLPTAAAG